MNNFVLDMSIPRMIITCTTYKSWICQEMKRIEKKTGVILIVIDKRGQDHTHLYHMILWRKNKSGDCFE